MNLLKPLGSLALATTLLASLSACGSTDNASSSSSDAALSVTDVVGRTVEFDKTPERVVLGEGRSVFATSILNNDDPFEHVVAMGSDLKNSAPSFYNKTRRN